jgi:aryl carrier-like protein
MVVAYWHPRDQDVEAFDENVHWKGIDQLQDVKRKRKWRRFDAAVSFVNLDGDALVAAVLPEVEELRQAVQAAAALEEIVSHELGRAGSRFDVHT